MPGEMQDRYGFRFDASRCTGCRACALACKDYHGLSDEFAFRQVYEFVGGGWTQDEEGTWVQDCFAYYMSVSCNHCNDPACMHACPTGAMHRDDFGLVTVDEDRCIGCGYCALSCPYRAPKVDRDLGHSVKCDGCISRVRQGRSPICVEACPVRAIEFGPIAELVRQDDVSSVPPLPDSSWTSPNLTVKLPVCILDKDSETVQSGKVANGREVV